MHYILKHDIVNLILFTIEYSSIVSSGIKISNQIGRLSVIIYIKCFYKYDYILLFVITVFSCPMFLIRDQTDADLGFWRKQGGQGHQIR